MRIIVAGSRTFDDYALLKRTMDRIAKAAGGEIVVLSGHCIGADRMGEEWANESGFSCEIHHSDWARLGKKAGMVRNSAMVAAADAMVVFRSGRMDEVLEDLLARARKAKLKIKMVGAEP